MAQLSWSAFSTAGVFSGHGPSSKVSTTSLSRKKSYCLKCSVPNAGPPVVSISTTRETLKASGLAQDAEALFGAGGGVAAPLDAAGAVGATDAGAAAFCATTIGATEAALVFAAGAAACPISVTGDCTTRAEAT